MSKHRQVALYVAEKAGGDPADRKQLLDMLGLLDPTGGGIVPDPTGKQLGVELTTAPYIKNDLPRTPGQPTYLREKRRAQFTTPAGLRNLAPLPLEEPQPTAKAKKKPKKKPKAQPKVIPARTPKPREAGIARPNARRTDLLPPTAAESCGTIRGRRQHVNRGESLCDPCRTAYNKYAADRRAALAAGDPKRTRPRPDCGTPYGARAHRWRDEPVCEACHVADRQKRREQWHARAAKKKAAES